MSYNDQGNHHLLIWLNRQRLLIGERHRIYSIEQIRQSRIIPVLLSNINHIFFSDVLDAEFDYKSYLFKIDKYLNQIEDLKFKRAQKQYLIQIEHISSLVKLILFLIMRHEIKHQFVNRILELEDETQIYLMCEIKRAQSWLESKMDFKEVYQTITSLEEENEMLNQKLAEIEDKGKQVYAFKTQLELQNTRLEDQHRTYLHEKTQIIEQFGISQPKDYMSIYKDLIVERNELVSSHSECEQLVGKLDEQNKEMQEKIVEDALIIQHLSNEISKYKSIYQHLIRSSGSISDLSKIEPLEKDCSVTMESTRAINFSEQSILQQEQSVIENREQGEDYCEVMQNYNEDLLVKLQEMNNRIGSLNEEISRLKTGNQKITKSNLRSERILVQACHEFQNFSRGYQLTIG